MHALRCALPLVSLVFGEVFFDGSASLHDLFLHFLAKCFFCNLFWGFFIVVVTCVGVNVHGGWCWNENCLRTVRVVYVSIYTPVSISIRKAFACMCMGKKVSCQGQLCN